GVAVRVGVGVGVRVGVTMAFAIGPVARAIAISKSKLVIIGFKSFPFATRSLADFAGVASLRPANRQSIRVYYAVERPAVAVKYLRSNDCRRGFSRRRNQRIRRRLTNSTDFGQP